MCEPSQVSGRIWQTFTRILTIFEADRRRATPPPLLPYRQLAKTAIKK